VEIKENWFSGMKISEVVGPAQATSLNHPLALIKSIKEFQKRITHSDFPLVWNYLEQKLSFYSEWIEFVAKLPGNVDLIAVYVKTCVRDTVKNTSFFPTICSISTKPDRVDYYDKLLAELANLIQRSEETLTSSLPRLETECEYLEKEKHKDRHLLCAMVGFESKEYQWMIYINDLLCIERALADYNLNCGKHGEGSSSFERKFVK